MTEKDNNNCDECTNKHTPLFLAVLCATALTWVSTLSCEFYKVQGWLDDDGSNLNFTVGLCFVEDWTSDDVYDNKVCTNWGMHPILSGEDLDGPMVVARALGILACTVSTLIVLCLFFTLPIVTCTPWSVNQHILEPLSAIMVALSMLSFLLLIALASDFCKDAEECSFGYAPFCSIVAGIVWVLAAVAERRLLKELRSLPPKQGHHTPTPLPPRLALAGQTQVEQTSGENGTRITTTTRTVTNEDGSQNVYVREYVEPAVAEATEVVPLPAPMVVEVDPGIAPPPPEAPPVIPDEAKPEA